MTCKGQKYIINFIGVWSKAQVNHDIADVLISQRGGCEILYATMLAWVKSEGRWTVWRRRPRRELHSIRIRT